MEQQYYGTYFRDWPWIIGEFACSDTQTPSRKSRWIAEMFDSLATGNYPNIKAAVWFSCNDYDSDGNIVHLLLLDRKRGYLQGVPGGTGQDTVAVIKWLSSPMKRDILCLLV